MSGKTDAERVAEHGLRTAKQRLAGATSNDDLLSSLAESLMWLTALEESRRMSGDSRCYQGRTDRRAQAQQVGGAIYARNLIQHQLAEVGRLADVYQDTYTATYGALTWLPFVQLPQPARPEGQLRDQHYQSHLENRSVLDTMGDMIAFLTT